MVSFLGGLFDTTGFPPRWNCGNWSAVHGWTHIIADSAIFSAYAAIPCVLAYFMHRRRDIPFRGVLWLFAAFILSCGFGHLVEATIFWRPWYHFSALVKVITAIVSWATVFALIPMLPQALALPGLAAVNKRLQLEIAERKQAEERFRLTVEGTPNAVVMINNEGLIVLVNSQTEKFFGYRRDELLGQPVELLVPDRFRAKHPDYRHEFFRGPAARSMGAGRELYGRRKDGCEFPVEIGLNPIQTSEGLLVLSAIVDITERKRGDEQLRESEDLFRSAFDRTNVAMVLTDAEHRFYRLNEAFARMFGYSQTEMLSMSMLDITHPDDIAESLARREPLLSGERQFFEMEKRYLHKDGRILSGLTNVSLVRGLKGQPLLYIGQVQDVTERKQAEISIVKYNKRLMILRQIDSALIAGKDSAEIAAAALPQLRSLLDVRRTVVNLFDLATGQVEWLAAAGMRRVHAGSGVRYPIHFMGDIEALRKGEVQFIDVHSLPASPEVDALLASEVFTYAVVPIIAEDDLIGAISFGGGCSSFSPEQIEIAREAAAQFAIAMRHARLQELIKRQAQELEERVQMRTAELETANKELEAFSYSVSHDLRAPLRAIDGFSRILLKEHIANLPAEALEYLQDIRANTQQMGQLIDDLLSFSRLGRKPISKSLVSPRVLVQQCLEELRDLRADRQIDITIAEMPSCWADAALLKQVWLNLLSNALKYTARRDRTTIEIGGHRNGNSNQITYFVKDNGVGFDMRYAQKLFGVFQRMHRSEEYEGTGVGLAIVARIIHRHGGSVSAEAQLDKGATFTFTLPNEATTHDRERS